MGSTLNPGCSFAPSSLSSALLTGRGRLSVALSLPHLSLRRRQRGVATAEGGRTGERARRATDGRRRPAALADGGAFGAPGEPGGSREGEECAHAVTGPTPPGEEGRLSRSTPASVERPRHHYHRVRLLNRPSDCHPSLHQIGCRRREEQFDRSCPLRPCLCFDRGESEVKHCALRTRLSNSYSSFFPRRL